ncbi:MAG: family 10 glycosylhydrolase [Armatimonadota bacterium]
MYNIVVPVVLVLALCISAVNADRAPVYSKSGSLDNRLCRIESRPGGPIKGDPKPWVDWIEKAGVDLWVFSAIDPLGNVNYKSKVGYPAGDFDPNFIKDTVRMAHERDIAIISWVGPLYSTGAGLAHPEWRQVYIDDPSQPPVKPEETCWLCPNKPEVREFFKTELKEIVGDLDFDGVWFDGTVFGSMNTIPFRAACVCPDCIVKFKADTGFDMPKKVDFNDLAFRRFVQWRYQVMDDYMNELTDAIRSVKPNAHVAIGNYYRPGHGWDCGTYLAPQKADATASGENNIVGDRAYETTNTGFNGRMMKAVNPYSFELWRPVWDIQQGWLSDPDPVQTTLSLLVQFTQGGHSFCGWGGTGESAFETLKPAFDELKKRAKWHGGEPVNYAAMMYSQRARDFSYPGGAVEYDRMAGGIYQALAESHIIFDFLLDGQLTLDSLKQYKVVVLPSAGCISEKEAHALKAYVEQGGHLIAMGETSLYDELGTKRDNFLLSDLYGVDFIGSKPYPAYPKTYPAGIVQDESMRKDTNKLIWYISPYSEVKLSKNSDAKVFMPIINGNEALGLNDDTAKPSDQPLGVIKNVGKGEVIYLAADMGKGYAESPYTRIRKIFANMVNRAEPDIKVEAPKVVEVTAFERDGSTIVHLVNSPLTSLRPPTITNRMPIIDEVIPIHNMKVSIKGDFSSARLEPAGKTLKIKKSGGWSTVTVPKVALHEMVVWKK